MRSKNEWLGLINSQIVIYDRDTDKFNNDVKFVKDICDDFESKTMNLHERIKQLESLCMIAEKKQKKIKNTRIKYIKCINRFCFEIISNDNDYGKYCLYHFFVHHSEINYIGVKAREIAMIVYILSEFSKYGWIINKELNKFKLRPDMLLCLESHYLVIECDENQHEKYMNEIERMKSMKDDLTKPVIFIRFNPDDYITDRQKYRSCWRKQDGKNVIFNHCNWRFRLNTLKETILEHIHNEPNNDLKIVYLFYDGDKHLRNDEVKLNDCDEPKNDDNIEELKSLLE